MDPNNQYPGGPQPQGNPYEFILNPNQSPKKKKFGLGGNKLAMVAAAIVGGALLIMIILTLLLNALAPKKISTDDLVGLAQTQTELLRISQQASRTAVQQVTRNLATTVEYTMITQQKQTLEVLSQNKVEVSEKELALKQNATTDQRFANAKVTSTFDKTYTEIIQEELDAYATTLKSLSGVSATKKERDRMSDYYRQVQQLISQVPYTEDTIDSAGTTQAAQ